MAALVTMRLAVLCFRHDRLFEPGCFAPERAGYECTAPALCDKGLGSSLDRVGK